VGFKAEQVYTIEDWYDGIIAAVVDCNGRYHYCCGYWDDAQDCFSNIFLLIPIDDETFGLAIEHWQIWLRWNAAYKAGLVTAETHPALPAERERYEELSLLLDERLNFDAPIAFRMKAEFSHGEKADSFDSIQTTVEWLPLTEEDGQRPLRLWNARTSSLDGEN
jgi:hypothetical protein